MAKSVVNAAMGKPTMGDDIFNYNISNDGPVRKNFGEGDDVVNVHARDGVEQVRLTFTSSEVGNGAARDSETLANQDGGLAVRMQIERDGDKLKAATSRFDDEGITFESNGKFTFDVRDLVSGIGRGDQFHAVMLATAMDDLIKGLNTSENYYINAGMGNDTVNGSRGDDFLVGGAGDDKLNGQRGNDSFIGGGGNDTVYGGMGDDTAIFNTTTDGQDQVNLGTGTDRVQVTAPLEAGQIRLTFTSAEVGNDSARDSNSMTNQDGGLAVRLQTENGLGELDGLVSRFDDEGITFVSSVEGVTFDVRDLVSGTARGDQFAMVALGTGAGDTLNHRTQEASVYINAGAGDDRIVAGMADDFLVGGIGNDRLNGGAGDDRLIGGAGNDVFVFNGDPGNDTILDFATGADKIDLSRYGIDFADVTILEQESDSLVDVDTNGDEVADFRITLTNASVTESDFLL
jgi:Ca2+-binding RTX toxin-like protein